MSKIFRLEFRQKIPVTPEKLWEFISTPRNLNKITPSYMGFEIKSNLDSEKAYPGQIIAYKVSPVAGIKLNWVTEITHVKENEYFVDEQRFGPYAFWHHKHFIKPLNNGSEMIDIIDYKLPLGIIGKLANKLFVNGKLNEIFEYRRRKLNEIFKGQDKTQ